jgi:hypothetical protein
MVGRPHELLQTALADAVAHVNQPLPSRWTTAYDLYSSAFSTSSCDARFLLLMMAIETLIVCEERDPATRQHVASLLEATRGASDLPDSQRASIVGSLQWLMSESIGQAGRRLATGLEGKLYMNDPPGKFFTDCYAIRSALAHGYDPRPARSDVDVRASHLEHFVADLLAMVGRTAQQGS